MRTFRGVNLKLLPPELIPVVRPLVEWSAPASRALAFSIQKKNNPSAVVLTPPETPPQPNPTTQFLDTQFRILDGAISSKQLAFECSTIPPSALVTLTSPAVSGTIALLSDITGVFAPIGAKYIVQEANATLTNEQPLGALTTGILRNVVTASVGVLETATGAHLPTHASRHSAGGDDTIKLDDLAVPDDNTDLNVSTSIHGLCPKITDTSKFLKGDGTWATPAGGGEAWPIGAVFIAVVSTNPNTLLGYGTWAAFGTGRVLVGIDSGDTDFDTIEETGGAKTKAISAHAGTAVADHASHTHDYSTVIAHTHTITDPGHDHDVGSIVDTSTISGAGNKFAGTGGGALSESVTTGITINSTGSATGTTTGPSATLTHSVTQPSAHSDLNVVQPYIVVHMWKRTA
jgi:hypothetical protein